MSLQELAKLMEQKDAVQIQAFKEFASEYEQRVNMFLDKKDN